MKKHYFRMMAVCLLAGITALTASAVERPTTKVGAPVNGEQYVLVSAYTPSDYAFLTGWDGSIFLPLGNGDKKELTFTAIDNGDGTWSFERTDDEGSLYMCMIAGTGNLKWNATEPVKWIVETGDIDGFVKLKADEGNYDDFLGLYLHLNAGGQYIVISEENNGGGWYPDYAGGTIPADNDYGFEVDENNRALMADHTSENFGFLKAEDLAEFLGVYGAYTTIKNLETYMETCDDDFFTGYNSTLAAVTAIYESPDFNWEEDIQTIEDMINKKKELESTILKAENVEDADASVQTAIENARTAFASVVKVNEIENAINALEAAVNAFKEGNGDITGSLLNPSFEDLSAQDGNPTTGIAAPPAGWNVYINGTQVTTADEVRQNGIANWHGVNADSNGEGKEGNYAFGIWTSGVPTYEISQTLSGLDNGTYLVKAGVMVGANGSGSRRTTQRLFGNLNSTYFASSSEYDESLLDQKEAYGFANLVEPTTDTELQPMEVRAYVYDGTLTFGLRTDGNFRAAMRETSNGAGGDGWFKLDNFQVQKLGYDGNDAAATANHFIQVITELEKELKEEALINKVGQLLAQFPQADASMSQSDLNNIITTLYGNFDAVKESVEAYKKLIIAIDDGYDKADGYEFYSGYAEYIKAIEKADDTYSEGTVTAAEIDVLIKEIEEAYVALQASGIAVGVYTEIIQNPSFEDMSAQNNIESDGVQNVPTGWNMYVAGEKVEKAPISGWCAINHGDAITETDENGMEWTTQYTDGDHLWGIWTTDMPEVELSQTFSGIPAGTYILSCDMVVQYNWGGHCVTTQRIFANDYIQMYGAEDTYAAGLNDTPDMVAAKTFDQNHPDADLKHMNYAGWRNDAAYGTTSCPHGMSLVFGVGEDGNLTLGFRTNNVDPFTGEAHPYDSAGWFKLDNFKLFYDSEEIPTGIHTAKTTGINTTIVSRDYFTAAGARTTQPQRGITIVRNTMSDGSVKAVKIVK